jgi:hypothetical protein
LSAAIISVAALATACSTASSVTSTSAPKQGHATTSQPARTTARTFPGPYGVESSAIIQQNKLPGTKDWKIFGTPPGFLDAFANLNYAKVGNTVKLYVSTDASTFRVYAYRMGFYGGDGARLVWSSAAAKGVSQPTCPLAPGVNMVSCDNWSSSLSFTVSPAFISGDYLLKLVGSGGQEGYVPLTIWDPSSHATYLVIARSLTEQGWNNWGGYDYYQGEGPCTLGSPAYPPCNRARIVSFDRPYNSGYGAADFLSNEFPLVAFAEQHGLDVTYVTDITVDEHPSIVSHHKALLSLGHDETWTSTERLAVQKAEAHGVNIVFFGAAALVRHARLQPSPLGRDREEVDYRDSSEDPLNGVASPLEVTGNTFDSPPTNWPETSLTGQLYSGYLEPGEQPVPLVVYDPGSWLFQGTGLGVGSKVPGVIDSDIDHVAPGYPMPSDLQVLAHSPISLSVAYTNQGQWGGYTYADVTYYTDPTSKAGVFDSGTTNWICAMSTCSWKHGGPGPDIQRMTGNLLRLFGQGPAGDTEPSVANWKSVTPTGS